jgi:hypothetical protein
MVPLFRNSIPRALLHESTPTSGDDHFTPQASFSSVDGSAQASFSSVDGSERSFSSNSNRCDDHAQNASRASSIHDLLNPMSPSESDSSTSFESHNVGQPSTQSSQSAVESEGTSSSGASRDCQTRPAALSTRSNLTSVGGYKPAESGNRLVLDENRNSSAASSSIVKRGGGSVGRISAEHFVSLDAPATSRKRVFDEMQDLALPSSQSSSVRLSMTLDGAVKVRTTDEETPSPPKQRPQNITSLRKEGLRRSHSAIAASELLKDGARNKARPSSGIFGRSRDARTWEFYCDGDARAALSAQADNESNGSAVGAINLIRCQSQNAKSKAQQRGKETALKPKIGAENARRPAASTGQREKLVRAMSSMARLPSISKTDSADSNKAGKISHARSSSGDSDKENWAPGTRCSNNGLRRLGRSSNASRDVLQDHRESGALGCDVFQADRLGHGEDKEEDLDCIQGLLSLSQGAWR